MRTDCKCRGFSFAEVMFAVVILGIGFSLVAAIFPVAIQQTQSNNDDAVAAQLARDAVKIIVSNTSADEYSTAANGNHPFTDTSRLWDQVSSSVICPSDPKYAWVPFSMKLDDATIQLTILVVRRVTFGNYGPADTLANGGALVPKSVSIVGAQVTADGTSTVTVTKNATASAAIAPGTFLVMTSGPQVVGKSFRLGQLISETPTSATWAIQLSGDVMASDFSTTTAAIIGRDCADLSANPPVFEGPAQDVAVYTTFFHPN